MPLCFGVIFKPPFYPQRSNFTAAKIKGVEPHFSGNMQHDSQTMLHKCLPAFVCVGEAMEDPFDCSLMTLDLTTECLDTQSLSRHSFKARDLHICAYYITMIYGCVSIKKLFKICVTKIYGRSQKQIREAEWSS